MKIRPFFTWIMDGVFLGPCASWDLYQVRVGVCLIFFEIGLLFSWDPLEKD